MSYDDECFELFHADYKEAVAELSRLQQLFKDAMYYNMDVAVHRRGKRSAMHRRLFNLRMYGQRHEIKVINGKVHEYCTFPLWYEGLPDDAEQLPLQIIQKELQEALHDVCAAFHQMQAPYDWAPGGYLYHRLTHTTQVGRVFSSG